MPRTTDYVEFFRYSDMTEDVFVEDDHYLYAHAEPYNWPYLLACRVYEKQANTFVAAETCGADSLYLDDLVRAPEHIAEQIIALEGERRRQEVA